VGQAGAGLATRADITGLAIDPSNRQALVAGAGDGRTFKSIDGGETWFSGADGPASGPIERLEFVDRTGGILFARQHSTILRSLDAGDHWEALPAGRTSESPRSFAVDPFSPSTVYVGTQRGVMVTTDLGLNWALSSRGITRSSVSVVFDPGPPSTLYARTVDDTFASHDGGATWSLSDRDASADLLPILKTTTDGFEYSTDGGGSRWQAGRLPNGEKLTGIAIAAGVPRTVYVSTGGILGPALKTNAIWRTLDGGEHWQVVDQPPVGGSGYCCGLIADPNDRNTVYAIIGGVGIDGGGEIRRTIDGGLSWSELPVGGLSYTVAVSPTVPTTLIVQAYDSTGAGRFALMTSTDRGDHWTRGGAGLPDLQLTNIVSDPRRPTHLFAGTQGRGVFLSTDAGATWRPTGYTR
jgi:photosystem II stability/assembly factor-like uncharacterized protein